MSEKYTFDKKDVNKVLKGAGIAALGAGMTYIVEWTGQVDFGDWTPIVVAVMSIIVNFLRKWTDNNQ